MILTPQSQLLERNIGMFEQGKWVIINPSDAYFLDQLKHLNITVMHQYFDIFSESVRVVPSLTFDSRDIAKQGFLYEWKCERQQDHLGNILGPS